MIRLTKTYGELRDVNWRRLEPGEVITAELSLKLNMALGKLSDYENTGLNPDQVESLKDLSSVCVMEGRKERT